MIFNKGAAFGILKGYSTFLIYIGAIFIIFLFFILNKNRQRSIWDNIIFGLILGGAISNMWDRIAYGFVIDYIDIRIWPIFNLSDMCICVGVIGLILKSLKKSEKNSLGI